MREWIWAGVAVFPLSFLVGFLFDPSDWQAWALLLSGAWWRFIGHLADRGAEDSATIQDAGVGDFDAGDVRVSHDR